ncbi:MAG: hypothetical protein WBF03_10890 [Xanthobacteraceae bacterium]
MWPLTSLPSYPSLNAPGRLDRAIGTLMAVAAALVIGVSIGGASVFALVGALTVPPKGSERSTPAEPVVAAAPAVNPSTGSATTTIAIPAQRENPAAQLRQPTSPQPTTTPTPSQVTSPTQEVKPWPDALSRASHPTVATTATNAATAVTAWRQSAPAAAPAVVGQRPEAESAKRTAGRGEDSKPSRAEALGQSSRHPVSSRQRTIVNSQDEQAAADEKTAAELPADDRRQIGDFFGNRHVRDNDVTDREKGIPPNKTHAGSFGVSRPTIVEPRDRNYSDERHGQWGDQRGGGFFALFGLFGRRYDRWADRDNWRENNRPDD